MGCNPCNTPGGSENPPGTVSPSSAAAGSATSFGGRTTIPQKACKPAPCPSPLVSDQQDRDPYCPDWVQQLLDATKGRLIIVTDDCLHLLKSKCTGFLEYNAETEEIKVGDPQYVSSIPQEVAYGFLAKVVTKAHQVCDDDSDDCPTESRQELASQIMGNAECGDLVIVNSPACGQLPVDEAADAGKQVRFDRATLSDMGDVCADGFRIMGWYPSFRTVDGIQVPCKKFVGLPRLKMRKSQWSEVDVGSADHLAGRGLILVPVAGGTEGDQCYELRMINGGSIPNGTACGDELEWDSVSVPPKWKVVPHGLKFYPLDAPVEIYAGGAASGNVNLPLPNFPTGLCPDAKITARLSIFGHATAGPSGAPTSMGITYGGLVIYDCGYSGSQTVVYPTILVTSASPLITLVKVGSGATDIFVRLHGYEY